MATYLTSLSSTFQVVSKAAFHSRRAQHAFFSISWFCSFYTQHLGKPAPTTGGSSTANWWVGIATATCCNQCGFLGLCKWKNLKEVTSSSNTKFKNPFFEEKVGIQTQAIHLEFPRFDDDDPNGWIYHANQFFIYHQTNLHHRVRLFSFYMEGKTFNWF